METLSFTSLHVAARIHTFSLTSRGLGFGMALRRAAKSPSSLVRVVGGRRGGRLRLPRYSVYPLREALRKHPRTN